MTGRAGRLRWAAISVVAVVAASALTGMYVAARYEGRLGVMVRETIAVRDRVQRSEAALRDQVAVYAGAVDLLRDPATRVIELRGQGARPQAWGRAVWNDRAGGQLFVANLPAAPVGRGYAVWIVSNTAPPRSAGVFQVGDDGRGTHRLPAAGGEPVTGFRVTLEPHAGTPAPAGPTLLASR